MLVKALMTPSKIGQGRYVYSFDEVVEYYEAAKNFGEAFKNVLSAYIKLGNRYQ